jgi:hypothetical protein
MQHEQLPRSHWQHDSLHLMHTRVGKATTRCMTWDKALVGIRNSASARSSMIQLKVVACQYCCAPIEGASPPITLCCV